MRVLDQRLKEVLFYSVKAGSTKIIARKTIATYSSKQTILSVEFGSFESLTVPVLVLLLEMRRPGSGFFSVLCCTSSIYFSVHHSSVCSYL